MKFALIGAGGHAKSIVDILLARQFVLECYVSPKPEPWLNIRHLVRESELAGNSLAVAMGMGGVEPKVLSWRLLVLEELILMGMAAPALVHPSATISPSAQLGAGVTVMPGAVVNAYAQLGSGVIVNSRAVVEHDAEVAAGTHVAPGAVVLGGVRIGRCCMVGAGSVVLQATTLPDHGFVQASSLYRGDINNAESKMP